MLTPHVFGFIGDGLWQGLVACCSAVALWMRQRAHQTPVDALTERLRHPARWAVKHPVAAIRRKLERC